MGRSTYRRQPVAQLASTGDPQTPLLAPGEPANKSYGVRRKTRFALMAAGLTACAAATFVLCTRLPEQQTLEEQQSRASAGMHAQALWGGSGGTVVPPGISFRSFQHGLSKCEAIQSWVRPSTEAPQAARVNPRAANAGHTLLIKNGHIWLGDRYLDGDIYVADGVIRQVGSALDVDADKVIDAAGRVVTPGIVDMHSHMGVASFPGLSAMEDDNEMTTPLTPYVRVIDAINPSDPAFKVVASGGITTSLILPGSGNLMGGEAAVIKLRPVPTLSVQDMLVTSGEEAPHWRYMKMACGENPKSYYGGVFSKMPMTRLGESYLFRRQFEEAQALLRAQDDWCDAAVRINKSSGADKPVNEETFTRLTERFPESIKLESLVALLRKQVKLNVHCYLPHDLEAMVDHSLEFDFEIAAFHHALSAWQVPDIIKRAKTNITIATFGDMWGYKVEAWDQNVHAPKILAEAGIPVAFKSDHPVMNARDLLHEAQKAYHYGYDEHMALAGLTSVPAKALDLDHRIGSIAEGKDADIVVWEQHPLMLGARPKTVVIDGDVMDFKKSWTKHVDDDTQKEETPVLHEKMATDTVDDHHTLPPRPAATMKLEDHGLNNPLAFEDACGPNVDSFVLRNVSQIYMGPGQTLTDAHALYLVVKDGDVVCAGSDCDRDHLDWPESAPVFEMGGAVLLPGIVSTGIPTGLVEISSESSTMDGYAENDVSDTSLPQTVVRAVDGLKIGGLHQKKAHKAGVTTAVSQPLMDKGVLAGVSVAFRMGVYNSILDSDDTVVREEAALHFKIHAEDKQMTVSQQVAAIRELLVTSREKDAATDVFARAAQGKLPVVVETHNKDEIASIVQMKQQLKQDGASVQFVILGGAEAHLVADHLARLDIPVVLQPARCYPITWQSRQCLAGPPLTRDTGLDILLRQGVRVGLASTDLDNGDARNLIWEAGWNLAYKTGMTREDAVGLVTWNLATIFGLDRPENPNPVGVLRQGRRADFIAYNGDPFVLGTQVLMVYGGGHAGPLCFPKQI